MLTKLVPILIAFIFLTWWKAILALLAYNVLRRQIVAYVYGLKCMDYMDYVTHITDEKCKANMITCSIAEHPVPMDEQANLKWLHEMYYPIYK